MNPFLNNFKVYYNAVIIHDDISLVRKTPTAFLVGYWCLFYRNDYTILMQTHYVFNGSNTN